jgi:hypothetical protein
VKATRGRLRCKFFPCRPTLTRIRLLGDLDITSISQIPLWGRCGSTLLGLVTTISNFSPFGRTSSAGPESMLSLKRLQKESVPRRLGFISTLTGNVRSSLENAAARNLMVRKPSHQEKPGPPRQATALVHESEEKPRLPLVAHLTGSRGLFLRRFEDNARRRECKEKARLPCRFWQSGSLQNILPGIP